MSLVQNSNLLRLHTDFQVTKVDRAALSRFESATNQSILNVIYAGLCKVDRGGVEVAQTGR